LVKTALLRAILVKRPHICVTTLCDPYNKHTEHIDRFQTILCDPSL